MSSADSSQSSDSSPATSQKPVPSYDQFLSTLKSYKGNGVEPDVVDYAVQSFNQKRYDAIKKQLDLSSRTARADLTKRLLGDARKKLAKSKGSMSTSKTDSSSQPTMSPDHGGTDVGGIGSGRSNSDTSVSKRSSGRKQPKTTDIDKKVSLKKHQRSSRPSDGTDRAEQSNALVKNINGKSASDVSSYRSPSPARQTTATYTFDDMVPDTMYSYGGNGNPTLGIVKRSTVNPATMQALRKSLDTWSTGSSYGRAGQGGIADGSTLGTTPKQSFFDHTTSSTPRNPYSMFGSGQMNTTADSQHSYDSWLTSPDPGGYNYPYGNSSFNGGPNMEFGFGSPKSESDWLTGGTMLSV